MYVHVQCISYGSLCLCHVYILYVSDGTVIPPGGISGQFDATEKRRISMEGRS